MKSSGLRFQGEGKSAGMPCAFLRLANCNLSCFLCDTDYTWRFDARHPHTNDIVYRREDEIHKMTDIQVLEALEATKTKALVISGGEPFLQQKQLLPLVHLLKLRGWWIEVETNGTLVPHDTFMPNVDQVNCSPKLDTEFSGESLKLRIRDKALKSLSQEPKVNFKFVICQESDIAQVLDLCDLYRFKEVRLMPECRTKEELLEKESWLEPICRERGFIYCTRLSILQSGTKRGV